MVTRRGLAGIAAAVALALGNAPASAQGVLKIGAINPYSGPMALYGDELTRGFELAVARANAAGGVLGRQIQIVRGSATNPQEGIAAVEQLVGRDKVEILVGTYVTAISNAASEAAAQPATPSRNAPSRAPSSWSRTGWARRPGTSRSGWSTRTARSAPPSSASSSGC